MGKLDLNYGVAVFVRAMFRDFAVFTGRVDRREFWHVFAVAVIIAILAWLPGLLSKPLGAAGLFVCAGLLFVIASAGVRRMHDLSLSGAWFFAPGVNIYLATRRGRVGPNRFGPDPHGHRIDAFA